MNLTLFELEQGPSEETEQIPSLLKWTGSKRSQAWKIRALAPPHERYIEPFLGSGAVLYTLAHVGAIAADIYGPLIRLWRIVRDEPASLVENYRMQWARLQKDLPAYYYVVRDRFNESENPFDLNFLLRTCVNGIVRFNGAGDFNNSFHLSRPGMHPDRFSSTVFHWHERIQGVEFLCQDYSQTLDIAQNGDFCYLDPPYLGNKQRYISDLNPERFFTTLDELNKRGIHWALSFDGRRGGRDLSAPVPTKLYKCHLLINSGHSAVGKVLNGPLEQVEESLYLNY